MSDKYYEWLAFYAHVKPMTVEQLRSECAKLCQVGAPCPEILLVHAMLLVESARAHDLA